jgi:hypothetical protein
MVKKLPTIERSKIVSIGNNILDGQATNTVVINASDEYINTDSNNVYISPVARIEDVGKILTYDNISKKLLDSNVSIVTMHFWESKKIIVEVKTLFTKK